MATFIVDTDSASTRDYGSLDSAITDNAGALTEAMLVICRASTGLADSVSSDINLAAITGRSATNTLTIEADSNHRPNYFYDTSKYRLEGNFGTDILDLGTSTYTNLDGLQIKNDGGSAIAIVDLGFSKIINCFMVGNISSWVWSMSNNSHDQNLVINNIFVNLSTNTNARIFQWNDGANSGSTLVAFNYMIMDDQNPGSDVDRVYFGSTNYQSYRNVFVKASGTLGTWRGRRIGSITADHNIFVDPDVTNLNFRLNTGTRLQNYGEDTKAGVLVPDAESIPSIGYESDMAYAMNGLERINWDNGAIEDRQLGSETDLVLINDMDDNVNTTGYGAGIEQEFNIEGSGCSGQDVDIETLTVGYSATAIDLTRTNIYIWGLCLTASFLDTWRNGGVQIYIEDGSSNWAEWYVAGSDTYEGGWRAFCISTSTTPDAQSTTAPDLTDITDVALVWKGVTKSKLSENCFTDKIAYSPIGKGERIVNGIDSDGWRGTWADVLNLVGSTGKTRGLLREKSGVYYLNGALQFGDSARDPRDLVFADESVIIRCEDKYRTFTDSSSPASTTTRTSPESLVDSDFFKITVVGTQGTNIFKSGIKSGTQGISGCIFSSAEDDEKFKFNLSDSDFYPIQLYGNIFQNAKETLLSDSTPGTEALSNAWSNSGLVDVGTGTFKFNQLIASPPGAAAIKLDSAVNSTSDCQFIGCDLGVEISSTDSYSFNNLVFS